MRGEPTSTEPFGAEGTAVTTWAEAARRFADAVTFWLATVRADRSPHLIPVWAVWVDGALYFSTSASSRKGRNLACDPRCVIAVGTAGLDLVIEGAAAVVRDERLLDRVADALVAKYAWRVVARDGALWDDEGSRTAGPPPYDVYRVEPSTAFGFGTDGAFSPTRWRFQAAAGVGVARSGEGEER
jgi:nitroimidazol reductase NimA-like FMN-containing flavoprotein (pyridoxamine 5'-phosphate oxidase superfamily)